MAKNTQLFGLNIESVHHFFSKLDKEHTYTISQLNEQVEQVKKENQLLTEEVNIIREELKAKVSSNVITFASERLPSLIEAINSHVEKEMADTREQALSEKREIGQHLTKIEKEISNGTNLLKKVISQITRGVENLEALDDEETSSSGLPFSEGQNQADQERASSESQQVFPSVRVMDDEVSNNDPTSRLTVTSSASTTVKGKHANVFENPVQKADAVSHFLLKDWEGVHTFDQLETNASSFWEGSEQFLAQALNIPLPIFESEAPKNEEEAGPITVKQSLSSQVTPSSQSSTQLDESQSQQEEKDPSQVEEATLPSSYKKGQSKENSSEDLEPSEGIRQEIEFIKRRYISGKIAGTTLKDVKGSIIIEKGEQINDEVVDRAHKAGVLSELIVNMRIPGLGE